MNRELIENRLRTERLGRDLELFDEIDVSTNDRIFELAKKGREEGCTVVAGFQKKGKGRMGREWLGSRYEKTLAMSFLLRGCAADPKTALIAALAVTDAVEVFGNSGSVKIKWPNDIVAGGKKLCGILTEYREINGEGCVAVGIGVNISWKQLPDEIKKTAASLADVGIVLETEELAAEILNAFEKRYEQLIKEAAWIQDYKKRMDGIGEKINVYDSASCGGRIESARIAHTGICEGVADDGRLLLRLEDGAVIALSGGEVSIRKE